MLKDVPLTILFITVWAYWGTVILLALYQRWRRGRSAGILPKHRYERRLWRLIMPVLGAWLFLPLGAESQHLAWLNLPTWAHDVAWVYGIRCAAAVFGVLCYLLSVYCWLLMGRDWSMAIVPGQKSQLVTGGLYRWVRHPIYSLQVGLMLASVGVLPTVGLALIACLHLVAMNLKARYEEQHLAKSFGPSYSEYCQRVGRFWPRWFRRAAV